MRVRCTVCNTEYRIPDGTPTERYTCGVCNGSLVVVPEAQSPAMLLGGAIGGAALGGAIGGPPGAVIGGILGFILGSAASRQ